LKERNRVDLFAQKYATPMNENLKMDLLE